MSAPRRRASRLAITVALAALHASASPLAGQDVRIRDLVRDEQAAPVRLLGYGLVTGLDGTGDRGAGTARGGNVTVQSVLNVLQRFGVVVPPQMLRAQNVAAVLVTAEVSPWLRVGAHFDIHVASIGDARSLRGGMLWITPLVADPNGPAFASAQGALLVGDAQAQAGDSRTVRWRPTTRTAANSATIADGGVLELALPKAATTPMPVLALRAPDRGTATRIATAINAALGAGTARVEDPGAVTLTLKGSPDEQAEALAKAQELRVRAEGVASMLVDARTGLVVAGGEATVQAATISVGDITLSIGLPAGVAAPDSSTVPRDSTTGPPAAVPAAAAATESSAPLRLAAGISVARVAEALRATGASGAEIAAVFTALRQVGALSVEVTVR
ncbi:MAG: flagellar basal body P-ring protein FlgI [Gemmatimonadaceae bacterium]